MSTRRKSLCVCLVILVGLVFFSGCGKSSQRAIIGKWEQKQDTGWGVYNTLTLKFSKDKKVTYSVSSKYVQSSLTGKYEFIEKDKIRFNWDEGGTEVYKFEISKDRLFLTSVVSQKFWS